MQSQNTPTDQHRFHQGLPATSKNTHHAPRHLRQRMGFCATAIRTRDTQEIYYTFLTLFPRDGEASGSSFQRPQRKLARTVPPLFGSFRPMGDFWGFRGPTQEPADSVFSSKEAISNFKRGDFQMGERSEEAS